MAWTAPIAENQNGYIREYQVRLVEIDTGVLLTYSTTEEGIHIPNLHPFYRYSYSIAAVTIGLGPYSEAAIIQMPEAGKSCNIQGDTV